MPENRSPIYLNQKIDNHVHTRLCGHATGVMEEYVQAAISKGLEQIVFLEHLEAGITSLHKTWLSARDFAWYFSEGERLKAKYSDRINIGLGVECGYNCAAVETLKAELNTRNWDHIGISCHYLQIKGQPNHINLFSRHEDNLNLARRVGFDELLTRYFKSLIEAVLLLPGTLLCHLDGALRHLPECNLTESHYELIDELLLAVRDRHMALEVNTSGLLMRGIPFPNWRIINRAATYKIPLVLGSDAHKPENVAFRFADFAEIIF